MSQSFKLKLSLKQSSAPKAGGEKGNGDEEKHHAGAEEPSKGGEGEATTNGNDNLEGAEGLKVKSDDHGAEPANASKPAQAQGNQQPGHHPKIRIVKRGPPEHPPNHSADDRSAPDRPPQAKEPRIRLAPQPKDEPQEHCRETTEQGAPVAGPGPSSNAQKAKHPHGGKKKKVKLAQNAKTQPPRQSQGNAGKWPSPQDFAHMQQAGIPGERPAKDSISEVLRKLEQADSYRIFLEPVTEQIAPGYFNIISEPMDIKRMRMKNRMRQYADWDQLWRDIKLMFDNARAYNPAENLAHKEANRLQSYAEKLMKVATGEGRGEQVGKRKLKEILDDLERREMGLSASEQQGQAKDTKELPPESVSTRLRHDKAGASQSGEANQGTAIGSALGSQGGRYLPRQRGKGKASSRGMKGSTLYAGVRQSGAMAEPRKLEPHENRRVTFYHQHYVAPLMAEWGSLGAEDFQRMACFTTGPFPPDGYTFSLSRFASKLGPRMRARVLERAKSAADPMCSAY